MNNKSNTNIILNSSNYDATTHSFKYKLPITQTFENHSVALTYVSIYKQFFNVSAENGNNQFTIKWIDDVSYNVTIPDGNYSIEDLNKYLTYIQFQNKLYLINTNSNNSKLYFIQLIVNPTQYGSQLFLSTVTTSSVATQNGYTQPSGTTWSLLSESKAPSISFNDSFGLLFGFSGGSYGDNDVDEIFNSDKTPQIAIVNALQINCNLVNNEYVNPPNIIGAMNLSGEYGSLLEYKSGYPLYSNISSRIYSEIEIYFSDQNSNKLSLLDPEVLIMLSIVKN